MTEKFLDHGANVKVGNSTSSNNSLAGSNALERLEKLKKQQSAD